MTLPNWSHAADTINAVIATTCTRFLCAVIVAAHGWHYTTWAWPRADSPAAMTTRHVAAPPNPSTFDSESPQQQGEHAERPTTTSGGGAIIQGTATLNGTGSLTAQANVL